MTTATESRIRARESREGKPDSPGSATTLKRQHQLPELPDKLPSPGATGADQENFAELPHAAVGQAFAAAF